MTSPPFSINIANDCEFSGSKINKHFCISWGSVIQNAQTGEILETNQIDFLRPRGKEWEPRCLNEFWLKTPELTAVYQSVVRHDGYRYTPEFGTQMKVDWIHSMTAKYCDNNPRLVTFVSDTCAADNSWCNYYLSLIDHEPLQCFFQTPTTYHYKDTLSTSAWAQGAACISTARADRILIEKGRFSEDKEIRAYLGIPETEKPTVAADHNPVNDCISILQEHSIHLKHVEARNL